MNPFDPGYFLSDDLISAGGSSGPISLNSVGFKSIGSNVRISRNSTIIGLQNISIGSNVRIDGNVTIVAAEGYLTIGNYVHVGATSHISAAGGVVFDDFSGISQGVRLYSGSDDYSGRHMTNPTVPQAFLGTVVGKVQLSRHCIIGSGSVVLPGCTLNEGAAVGALSLVTKDLEEWSLYLGTPARKIKSRRRDALELESRLKATF